MTVNAYLVIWSLDTLCYDFYVTFSLLGLMDTVVAFIHWDSKVSKGILFVYTCCKQQSINKLGRISQRTFNQLGLTPWYKESMKQRNFQSCCGHNLCCLQCSQCLNDREFAVNYGKLCLTIFDSPFKIFGSKTFIYVQKYIYRPKLILN